MSYIIEPMQLTSFLNEPLKLPRFQRKSTWDKNRNFELAISIFKDYPIGVVIINSEQNDSWLLDGRQRKTALSVMRSDPVELYKWAQKYIGFKSTHDNIEIKKRFWSKVEEYLQSNEDDLVADMITDNAIVLQNENDTSISDIADTNGELSVNEDSFDIKKQKDGLSTLLDLILMVHPNKSDGSKWEKLFDFQQFFSFLKYAPRKSGNKVQPVLLREFLYDFINKLDKEYDGDLSQQNFIDYYNQNSEINNQIEFENHINKYWKDIKEDIEIISRSEKLFSEARIGVIRLKNASPLDAQNIFSRINTGGTQLKAEELLSAKPYWNREVVINDNQLTNNIKEMYRRLEIPYSGENVRWDLAATLVSRINDNNLLFEHKNFLISKNGKNDIDIEEISIGFKILSALYNGGISKKHVSELEGTTEWYNNINTIIDGINIVIEFLLQDNFFKYFLSWQKPLIKLIGNSPVIEFIILLYNYWSSMGKSRVGSSSTTHSLCRNSKILFDKLIFEYTTRLWRGSSDSKVSNDLKNSKERFTPIEDAKWMYLLDGLFKGNYNGQPVDQKVLTPILYYYSLRKIAPQPNQNIKYDIDHIIPKIKFQNNISVNSELKNSLGNLCLLPKKDNIYKGTDSLNQITDSWLRNQILIYTDLTEHDFDRFSDISNLQQLCQTRKEIFERYFEEERRYILTN